VFDPVITGAEISIIRTPVRAPRVNAFAEHWIGTYGANASTTS